MAAPGADGAGVAEENEGLVQAGGAGAEGEAGLAAAEQEDGAGVPRGQAQGLGCFHRRRAPRLGECNTFKFFGQLGR